MERRWWLATIALILFCAAVQLAILPDYGVTWDEPVQSKYGELVVDYFKSGLTDLRWSQFGNLRFYPPAFEALAAAIYAPVPQMRFEVRHLLVLLTSIGGLFAVAALARKRGSPALPLFAVIALVCTPQYFGHSFSNSKDIPFAVLFAAAILAIHDFVDRPAVGSALVMGCALGAATSTRVAGVVLPAFLAVALVVRGIRKEEVRRLVMLCALSLLVAATFVILTWPFVQQSPLHNLVAALDSARHFPVRIPVLFEGRRFWSNDPPRDYLLAMLAVTTPIPLLVLASGGTVLALLDLFKRRDVWSALLLLWIAFPLVYFVAARPTAYDGVRHYLFVLPAIALIAARGASAGYARLNSVGSLVVLVLALASAAPRMIRLHPYEYTYFNAFVGGTRGASDFYETDYWLFSYRALAQWVAEHPCTTSRPPRILLAGDRNAVSPAAAYLPPGSRIAYILEPAALPKLPDYYDYYISTTRYALDVNFPQTPIVMIEQRENAIFAIVRSNCAARRK